MAIVAYTLMYKVEQRRADQAPTILARQRSVIVSLSNLIRVTKKAKAWRMVVAFLIEAELVLAAVVEKRPSERRWYSELARVRRMIVQYKRLSSRKN